MTYTRAAVWLRENSFGSEILSIVLALYFTLFLNSLFWTRLVRQDLEGPSSERTFYVVTIGIALVATQAVLLSLCSWGRLSKVTAAIFTLIAAIAAYFSDTYGTYFDTGMLRNVLATNLLESRELLTTDFFLSVTFLSATPLGLIFIFPMQPIQWQRRLLAKALTIVALISTTLVFVTANYKTFSAAIRNNREIRHLIVPISPVISLVRVLGTRTSELADQKRPLDVNAVRKIAVGSKTKPRLTVVVVGETVRAQNWGLSGYTRQTTPLLSEIRRSELFNFPYAIACGTSTEVSVPCMFSAFGLERYSEKGIRETESVLGLLHRLGVKTSWVDNQSGCKGACDGIPKISAQSQQRPNAGSVNASVFDESLVGALQTEISITPVDQVIVLHMIGNHGPAYSNRYPESFSNFLPECHDSGLADCDRNAIKNSYDNAVLYTDYVLSQLISTLRFFHDRDVILTYVSDHGESLGENGLYLHGLPRLVAPEEQLRVPFFLWVPPATQRSLALQTECMAQKITKPTTHDLLAHTLLGLYDVQTDAYRSQWDFFRSCRG